MKKVFITDFNKEKYRPKELFPLTRPFLNAQTGEWGIEPPNLNKWGCSELEVEVTNNLGDSDFILVSEPLNHDRDKDQYRRLDELNAVCAEKNIYAYVFIAGDYGKVHPHFSNVIYYRMGGFKSQLNENNRAFFPVLGDYLKRFFDKDEISLRNKLEIPTVGFCGHATKSVSKLLYEKLKMGQINAGRALAGDFKFEPLFASAFERLKILTDINGSPGVKKNFIYRGKYRAGASTEEERLKTAIEYYNNILESDYVVCLRGSGNFSVRFYETLMMGRIPVFINTDCLLPLEDEIDWKRHSVWVEWKERKNIAELILQFHASLTPEEFMEKQTENREIWKSYLNVRHYLEKILDKTIVTIR